MLARHRKAQLLLSESKSRCPSVFFSAIKRWSSLNSGKETPYSRQRRKRMHHGRYRTKDSVGKSCDRQQRAGKTKTMKKGAPRLSSHNHTHTENITKTYITCQPTPPEFPDPSTRLSSGYVSLLQQCDSRREVEVPCQFLRPVGLSAGLLARRSRAKSWQLPHYAYDLPSFLPSLTSSITSSRPSLTSCVVICYTDDFLYIQLYL